MKMKSKRKKGEKLSQNLAKTLLQFIPGRRYKPATYEELVEQLAVAPVHRELLLVVLGEQVGALPQTPSKDLLRSKKVKPLTFFVFPI
jgi:hypothetical protein